MYKGNSLWIADDATLIAGSITDMEHNIEILRNSAREYGLGNKWGKKQSITSERKREREREI